MPVLAVDLGGTKINAAVVSSEGQVIAREYRPTMADEGARSVIRRLQFMIDHLLSLPNMGSSQPDSISIGAAGAIDSENGVVTFSPNLPGWHNIPLRDMIREKSGVDTFLINDASAAVLGEHQFGAGKGINNLVMLTVGTGIGGGIIINGKLYTGPSGSAGEIGHMTIDLNGPKCPCGNVGCLEKMVSGSAIAREAIRRLSQGEQSVLVEMADGNIASITSENVGSAARNGDKLAKEVVSQAAVYLGIGLVNLVNIFNPEMIVIGGGLAKMGDLLLEPARQIVRERAFPVSARLVRIVTTELGDDAGLLGAAVFAFQQKKPNWGCS